MSLGAFKRGEKVIMSLGAFIRDEEVIMSYGFLREVGRSL